MDIQIEPNRKFGHGFQVRFIDGPAFELYDDEPLTMLEALETLDEVMGVRPSKMTMRPVNPQDALSGPGEIVFRPKPDVRETATDGEKRLVVSARDVILLAWAAWKKEGSEQSKDVMRRYCDYISAHGYRGAASKAMAELEAMSFNHGAKWIKRIFARHVRDGVALMRYVLP